MESRHLYGTSLDLSSCSLPSLGQLLQLATGSGEFAAAVRHDRAYALRLAAAQPAVQRPASAVQPLRTCVVSGGTKVSFSCCGSGWSCRATGLQCSCELSMPACRMAQVLQSKGIAHLCCVCGCVSAVRLCSHSEAAAVSQPVCQLTQQMRQACTQGLGLEYARQLAKAGAQALVLTSRQPQLPQDVLEELAAHGVAVFTVAADAGQAGDAAAVLRWVHEHLPACSQLVHAAGVSGFALLPDMQPDELWTVGKPKVCIAALRLVCQGVNSWLPDAFTMGSCPSRS